MHARRRSTLALSIIAAVAFIIMWPMNARVCDPNINKLRPPQEEGTSFASVIFKGGGGTPAIFAMLGGQRYLVANILWNYSDVLFHDGKPYEMVNPLEATVTLNPSFLEAWSVYGWHLAWNLNTYTDNVVMKEKWRDDGERIYKRAIAANPTKPRPYFDLAWLYIQRMGSYEKAMPLLEAIVYKGVDIKQPDGTVKHHTFVPMNAEEKELFKEGKLRDERLETRWIPEIYAHRLAFVYKKMGIKTGDVSYFQKAIDTYKKALEIIPDDDAAKLNIADLTKHMHDPAWLAEQRKNEARHRETYGMGPQGVYYGQDRHDGHDGHDH